MLGIIAFCIMIIGAAVSLFAGEDARPRSETPLRLEALVQSPSFGADIGIGCLFGIDVVKADDPPDPALTERDLATGGASLSTQFFQLSLEPDVAAGEYVVLEKLDVLVEDYQRPSEQDSIVTTVGACSDSVPRPFVLDFSAILAKAGDRVQLLQSPGTSAAIGNLILRAGEPTTVNIHWRAQKAGWYSLKIAAKMRYRGSEQWIAGPSLRIYDPGTQFQPHSLYSGNGHFDLQDAATLRQVQDQLGGGTTESLSTFPPHEGERSGLLRVDYNGSE